MGSAHSNRIDNADENDLQYENKLRTLLVLCPQCKMYKLPDDTRNILQEQYRNGFPAMPMSVCQNCCIVSEQKGAIEFLNGQISELSNALEKWRNIRSIENEIDVSYSQLNATADDVGLSDEETQFLSES